MQSSPSVCAFMVLQDIARASLIHCLLIKTGAAVVLVCNHLASYCRVGPLVPATVKQSQMVQPACMAQSLEHSRQGTVQGKRPLRKASATLVRLA